MSNKKIFIVGSFNKPADGHYGGLYYACKSLTAKLEDAGYTIVKEDYSLKNIEETGVIKRLPSLISRVFKTIYSLNRNRDIGSVLIFISAGNSYIDKLPVILRAKALRRKTIVLPRSGYVVRDYKKAIYKRTINAVFNSSNYIICQSNFWKDFFASAGVPENKLTVIENWAEDKIIEQSKTLHFTNYTKGDLLSIVYVNRIEENKGILDVLESAKLLMKKNISFQINIYGGGAYVNRLLKEIKNEGLDNFVNYKGWLERDELLIEVNKNHIALFTSKFEGFPNSLLDLIFSKIPVISTDIESVKAVGREYLQYYKPGDVDSLTNNILKVADNYNCYRIMSEVLYTDKLLNNNIGSAVKKIQEIL